MKIKHTIAAMLATTLAADAAIILTSVTRSGTDITFSISGTLDHVGGGNDIGSRQLLFLADKRLGDGVHGVSIGSAGDYDILSGLGGNNTGSITGTLGSTAVGAINVGDGTKTEISGTDYGLRRDGNGDTAIIRTQSLGSGVGVGYVAFGFGDGFGVAGTGDARIAAGTDVNLTMTFSAGSTANANAIDTVEEFSNLYGLFVNDGSNNEGINATSVNYNEIVAVPEPSSTALLGLGGLALILRRRK